jgi:hypothetical protein
MVSVSFLDGVSVRRAAVERLARRVKRRLSPCSRFCVNSNVFTETFSLWFPAVPLAAKNADASDIATGASQPAGQSCSDEIRGQARRWETEYADSDAARLSSIVAAVSERAVRRPWHDA